MPAAKGSARTPLGPIPKIVAAFVFHCSQGQRTHSAQTNSVNNNHQTYFLIFFLSDRQKTDRRQKDRQTGAPVEVPPILKKKITILKAIVISLEV